jgi:hypothetical protein
VFSCSLIRCSGWEPKSHHPNKNLPFRHCTRLYRLDTAPDCTLADFSDSRNSMETRMQPRSVSLTPHLVEIYLFNRGNRYENTNVRTGWNHELFTLMKWGVYSGGDLKMKFRMSQNSLHQVHTYFPGKHNFIWRCYFDRHTPLIQQLTVTWNIVTKLLPTFENKNTLHQVKIITGKLFTISVEVIL